LPAYGDYPFLSAGLFKNSVFPNNPAAAQKGLHAMQSQVVRLSAQWKFFQGPNGNIFNMDHPMVKRIMDYHNLGIAVMPVIAINAP